MKLKRQAAAASIIGVSLLAISAADSFASPPQALPENLIRVYNATTKDLSFASGVLPRLQIHRLAASSPLQDECAAGYEIKISTAGRLYEQHLQCGHSFAIYYDAPTARYSATELSQTEYAALLEHKLERFQQALALQWTSLNRRVVGEATNLLVVGCSLKQTILGGCRSELAYQPVRSGNN